MLIAMASIAAVASTRICAQIQTTIKTDASWARTPVALNPTATATTVRGGTGKAHPVAGRVYTIPQDLGRIAGSNLFHSFESFDVGNGDAAVFTTRSSSIANVISRVTSASPSTIEGLLVLRPENGGNPNFYFVNPNGITFGAGAQIDVPGAFHVSTANNLRFPDTTRFAAGNGSDSTLTVAAPAAFGFLGTSRGSITVKDGAELATAPGRPLDVIGADVAINAGRLVTRGGATCG
jgi:filamentous hemagglutinin family protein